MTSSNTLISILYVITHLGFILNPASVKKHYIRNNLSYMRNQTLLMTALKTIWIAKASEGLTPTA